MEVCAQLEFMVQMRNDENVDDIKTLLSQRKDVDLVSLDKATEQVIINTSLTSSEVRELLESTSRRVVLQGMGSATDGGSQSLGAAVSMILGDMARGVTRLVQVDPDTCIIEGTVDGLSPGTHGLFIHELGDVSRGCASCGEVYDSRMQSGGKKAGDLGLITATEDGRARYRLNTSQIKVWDVIGRSIVIHTADERVACGIIARSSGLFENDKRICACDGVTLWDERDVPIAGPGRSRLKTHDNTNATCCHSGT